MLKFPRAEIIAHPECQENLLQYADFIGSTSKLINYTKFSSSDRFIVLTEPGIMHQMRNILPNKNFISVPGVDGCSCNVCPYMRLNTLEKLAQCLRTMSPEINLSNETREKALIPIQRMLKMSN